LETKWKLLLRRNEHGDPGGTLNHVLSADRMSVEIRCFVACDNVGSKFMDDALTRNGKFGNEVAMNV